MAKIYSAKISGRDVEIDATVFRPSWSEWYTVEEAEKELSWLPPPFEFKGPGWYIHKTQMLLVIPSLGHKDPAIPQKFLFCVFDGNQACNAFNWIVNAPVQVDQRGE